MDTNIAAWMIAGGPRIETHADAREREHLSAFREGQRLERANRIGLIERIRAFARPQNDAVNLACCPA
jgi:hypothetical protein